MLSAVILAHNDESILPRCIRSLSWCNETIVIDDESTDDTVAVAKKLGARVYVRPLGDDFAAQRNVGLTKAKGEWVLFVDSDEVVSDELASEIKRTIRNKQEAVGFYVKRKDFLWMREMRYGETGSMKILRLARKNAGRWVQPVHEEWSVGGETGELVHPLLHYPHPNVAQFLEEINRYSTVYAAYLHARGVREPAWAIVGKPVAKFFVNYLWRLGFLDGTRGFLVALMMSFHSFLVRGKLWHRWQHS